MSIPLKLMRFACVGSVGTAIQYLTLGVGISVVPSGAAVWSMIGYAAGSVANYLLNYHFTFACGTSHVRAATRYYVVLGVGLFFNGIMMTCLVHQLSWNHWIAQILTTTVTLLWNFFGSHKWAFRDGTVTEPLTGSVCQLTGTVEQREPIVLMNEYEETL